MEAPIFRILDANCNRAREALRVIEDYARFILNSDTLCAALKHLRHDLQEATSAFTADAILHRDTPGDVGVNNTTTAEFARENLQHVVIAAGKRLGEALRTIEEYAKIDHPDCARSVESIRYRFYTIEQTVAQTLRPAACDFASVRLYVLITESSCKLPWLEVARAAIDGGANCLQLREKSLESGEFLVRARAFVALCKSRNVISIINDRPDIAMLSGADGVHVGQDDLPARDVRKLIGPDKILGVSTHRIEDARQAVLEGADYIGVGPVFLSPTKPRDFLPGLDYARQVANEIKIPAVAIAGITLQNVDEVTSAGIRAIAVTSAITGSDDPGNACGQLKQKLAL